MKWYFTSDVTIGMQVFVYFLSLGKHKHGSLKFTDDWMENIKNGKKIFIFLWFKCLRSRGGAMDQSPGFLSRLKTPCITSCCVNTTLGVVSSLSHALKLGAVS